MKRYYTDRKRAAPSFQEMMARAERQDGRDPQGSAGEPQPQQENQSRSRRTRAAAGEPQGSVERGKVIDKRELRYNARKARFAEDAVKMKELRRKLGVSQSEMARKTGVSSSLIWNIENGRGYLSKKMLKRLEIAFPEQNTHSGAMNQNTHSSAVNQNTHSESNGNNTAEAGTGAACRANLQERS